MISRPQIQILRSRNRESESTQLRGQCGFSFIIISQLRRPIELKFSQADYFMHMSRYTKWGTGLRQLPIVSYVFKEVWVFEVRNQHELTHHSVLKTLDTIGNCQRTVFSLGVSQHMHKITNLWKFELKWSSKVQDMNELKNTIVTRSCVLSDAWFRDLKF